MMYGHEKSDPAIVAGKPTNKAERSATELVDEGQDQRECGPTKHAPDSEPGKRDTWCWLAYGNLLPLLPEVGAACGKAARADLCGGHEVTRVPTAKTTFLAGFPLLRISAT
jgi:hypothetical protein